MTLIFRDRSRWEKVGYGSWSSLPRKPLKDLWAAREINPSSLVQNNLRPPFLSWEGGVLLPIEKKKVFLSRWSCLYRFWLASPFPLRLITLLTRSPKLGEGRMEVLHTEQPSRLYLEQRSFASLITGFTIISFKVLTLKLIFLHAA